MGRPELPGPMGVSNVDRRRRLHALILPLSVLALYCLTNYVWSGRPPVVDAPPPKSDRPQTATAQPWSGLVPKQHLEYTACFNDFQCAYLAVSLDYWNQTTNETIALAVMRKPAVVPVTHKQYGGAVLLNPGGPGGSGVAFLLGAAHGISGVIDTDDATKGKYYDLISFDPRGVGLSGPVVSCFENPDLEALWNRRLAFEGLLESSDAALGRLWSMATAYGESCSIPPDNSNVDGKAYVSTASVARDMLSIIEAHGEWRANVALQSLRPVERNKDILAMQSIAHLLYAPDTEKLQYWGFSYGTYLGNTFAAMFPDRVHRIIVDGVVDAYDYTKALWSDNLVDAEKDLDLFYYHCARVGHPDCALANETDETTFEGVRDKVKNITDGLLHNPLPIIGKNPNIITYSDVKSVIFSMLYSPIQAFPFVAYMLQKIHEHDGDFFNGNDMVNRHQKHNETMMYDLTDRLDLLGLSERHAGAGLGVGITMAIACSDGDDQTSVDKAGFIKHWRALTKVSPSAGSIWAMLRLHCIHYSVRPKYRWPGPWQGNTSHPILLIGNTADPVTPGRYAVKMSKGYKDAVALLQDSPGHCSLAAPSKCTWDFIRAYFQTGALPPPDTICPADEIPFGGLKDEATMQRSTAHLSIMEALLAANGGFHSPRRQDLFRV